MAIRQFTLLFGDRNYALNVPINENTEYKLIDGHEVLTLAIKENQEHRLPAVKQKEFPWMDHHERAAG